jgi:clan AA aspartic protease (TIGR02281 family)
MAVVVAIGFASLQGGERPERRVERSVAEHGVASARSDHLEERSLEDQAFLEDDGDAALEDDGDAADEAYSEDDGYSEDDSGLEYAVEADPSGHYLIEAAVNGAPVTFLVDTGASDIVLTLDDARRAGLRPGTLAFTQRFATANGEVRGAPVVLREVRIGQLRRFDVAASVNEAPLGVSLLGMSFLEQLSGYEVERGRLILRW